MFLTYVIIMTQIKCPQFFEIRGRQARIRSAYTKSQWGTAVAIDGAYIIQPGAYQPSYC